MRLTRDWPSPPTCELVLIFLMSGGYHSVHIERIAGPEVVQSGSELMLDCNYSYLDEEESQLDLKWYFNGSPIPVYQWVPSMSKGPQVIGELFKHKLDLDYVAHNDTYKKHRALRVVKSDHRFSGTYQCKVSSFVDEDFQTKNVLVFSKWGHLRWRPANFIFQIRLRRSSSVQRESPAEMRIISTYPVLSLESTLYLSLTSPGPTSKSDQDDDDDDDDVSVLAHITWRGWTPWWRPPPRGCWMSRWAPGSPGMSSLLTSSSPVMSPCPTLTSMSEKNWQPSIIQVKEERGKSYLTT